MAITSAMAAARGYRECQRVLVVSLLFARQVQRLANDPWPANENTARWMWPASGVAMWKRART
jgi:hypothetical protein